MSLADRLKRENEERKVAGKHPLVAMDLARVVRDAYFRGVALAAFVDDGKMDESERKYLRRLGIGLGLPDSEVEDLIGASQDCTTEDNQLALLKEVLGQLGKDPAIVKLFLAEFSMVWKSHSADVNELSVYRSEISEMVDVAIPPEFWQGFDAIFEDQVRAAENGCQLDGFDEGTMAYLFPAYARAPRHAINDKQPATGATAAGVGLETAMQEFETAMQELLSAYSPEPANNQSSAGKKAVSGRAGKFHVRAVLCNGCRECLSCCPESAFDVVGDSITINQSRCTKCGRCAAKCPKDAIVSDAVW